MLKTISAALLAASMIAAPAFAAGTGNTVQTSRVKTEQTPAINGAQAKTGVKTSVKSGALNANAKMRRHHHKYHKMGALKLKKSHAKVGFNGTKNLGNRDLRNTKLANARFGSVKTHVSKTHVNKTQVSRNHANKSHSKVSLHTARAIKRG